MLVRFVTSKKGTLSMMCHYQYQDQLIYMNGMFTEKIYNLEQAFIY
jgi:hypothetical protein